MQRSTGVSKSSNTRHAPQLSLVTDGCTEVIPELDPTDLNGALIILRDEEGDSPLREKAVACLVGKVAELVREQVPKVSEREDITQQVLLNVLKGIKTYNPLNSNPEKEPAQGWLYVVVRNTYVGSFRNGKMPPVPFGVPDDATDTLSNRGATEPVVAVIHREDQAIVNLAVQLLDEDYRVALTRFYIDGAKWRTIAKEMGKTDDAMKFLATRARARLKEILTALKYRPG